MSKPQAHEYIYKLKPYVGGKSKVEGIEKTIKLSSNENPLGASPKATEAYKNAAFSLNRYPDGAHTKLREAIAKHYNLDEKNVVCGVGSDEIIALLIHCYAGVGDEIIHTEHGFLMYQIYAKGFGAVPVKAKEENLTTSVDEILKVVTDKTRIVFIANPNNPTGSYISRSEIERLRKSLADNIILAIDGAYAEYVEEDDYSDCFDMVKSTDNTVVLRTFSKIYGLSSLRIGFGYAPDDIADALNRARGPFNVSTPASDAAIAALEDREYIKKVVEFNRVQREYLRAEFTQIGLHVYPSAGNFLLVKFPENKELNAESVNAKLMAKGIIVRDTVAYGLSDCLRISVGSNEENQTLVSAIKQIFSNAVSK